MIFWSGHGILIPIFAAIGVVFGFIVGIFLGGERIGPGLSLILGGLFGTGLVWLYALTFGKTQEHVLMDPNTGREVRVRRSNTFFFIPALPWAIISSLGAGFLLIAGSAVMMAPAPTPAEEIPGAVELKAAESLISSKSKGVVHGNTPEAREMAEVFSKSTEALREVLVEKGSSSSLSLSGGNFLTYCQVSDHGVAFLVHVPSLRKFTDEAKEVMSEAAWFTANQAVLAMDPLPEKLAVGVRGIILYESIMIGVPTEDLESDPTGGILEEYSSQKPEVLHAFFAQSDAPEMILLTGDGREIPIKDNKIPVKLKLASPEESTEPETVEETVKEVPSKVVAETPAPEEPKTEEPGEPAPLEAEVMPEEAQAAETRVAVELPTEVREWTAADGRSMQAALVRFTDAAGEIAEFKRDDGQVFSIPLERFSEETRTELREIFERLSQP